MASSPTNIDEQCCTTDTLSIRGMSCTVHVWNNNTSSNPKGIAVVYHGFLAHSKYPTVRYAAELLAQNGYLVVAADLPGHGKSPGTRGYIPSATTLIQDGVTIAQYALKKYSSNNDENKIPLFLVGSSMGGTIALAVSLEMKEAVSGVVLLAPMLAIDVNEPSRLLLKTLSYIAPTLQVIPSSSTSAEVQYRDVSKRHECESDKLSIPGSTIRIGSACTCVELCKSIQSQFNAVEIPFLCLIASEDVVVDNSGAMKLMEESPSNDKTLKEYKALHGLLCEPSPLVDEIHADLLSWLQERTLA